MIAQQRSALKTPLEKDLVGRVFLNGIDDLVVLVGIAELDRGALVAEQGVEGVELAEGGEDVVDRWEAVLLVGAMAGMWGVLGREEGDILCKKKIVIMFPPVSRIEKYLFPTGTGSVPPICAAHPTHVELNTLPILPSSSTFLMTSVTGLVCPCILKHVLLPFSFAV